LEEEYFTNFDAEIEAFFVEEERKIIIKNRVSKGSLWKPPWKSTSSWNCGRIIIRRHQHACIEEMEIEAFTNVAPTSGMSLTFPPHSVGSS